jgi:UDP-N-acetylmuramate--alanine ligase
LKLSDIHNVYFLGIGGIGMSALARWFILQGKRVAGYDRTATVLTRELEKEGMEIHFDDDVENFPVWLGEQKEHTLVIYTPAIPKDHQEYNYLLEEGYTIKKRAEVLGIITQAYFTIAVAGTHGKTTTSSMVAHILKASGKPCSAFLGGIATNYQSNMIWHEGAEKPVVVVEADEFDRSFLWLKPNIAVLTATDADHLDIYGEHHALLQSFRDFIGRINPQGQLYLSKGAEESLARDVALKVATKSYSATAQADCRAENIRIEEGLFVFDYVGYGQGIEQSLKGLKMQMPGFHNIENAVAAISVALQLGLTEGQIRSALEGYRGVKRRFEYIIRRKEIVFIDDYAHHPAEISALLKSVKALYPDKKVTAIFQPHLFSRTRDFAEGFGASLSLADEVILTSIYPARELPIEGVSADLIYRNISHERKQLIDMEQLPGLLKGQDFEVVLSVGAGDIDKQVKVIRQILEDKYETKS